MSLILGIESTCDETGAAIVKDGRVVQSNVVASQVALHERYRGVVPEIASRAHIENILPVIRESLTSAGYEFTDLDAIAVAHRPGLIGSLFIGVTTAKTLAWSLAKPLIGVDHVHAHLYSVVLDSDVHPEFPAVGVVVSGGHTALYDVKSWTEIELIGSTIDDAVGEAYDKVSAILGLGYPGGPVIDRLAQEGVANAIRFPRSLLGRESLDFSFSGLKTAVLYHVRGVPGRDDPPIDLNDQSLRNIAASFQAACVDTLLTKMKRALRHTRGRSVIVGGGVSANSGLRNALPSLGVPIYLPTFAYCTDNAAMTAGLAHVLFERRRFSDLDLDAITSSQFAFRK